MPANDRLGPNEWKVAAPVWKDSPDQNPEEPVTRLEREAAPRSQRRLELLAKQEILQDQVVPSADCRPSRTDDQRKELRHRRRIAVRPSPLRGATFALRQPALHRLRIPPAAASCPNSVDYWPKHHERVRPPSQQAPSGCGSRAGGGISNATTAIFRKCRNPRAVFSVVTATMVPA